MQNEIQMKALAFENLIISLLKETNKEFFKDKRYDFYTEGSIDLSAFNMGVICGSKIVVEIRYQSNSNTPLKTFQHIYSRLKNDGIDKIILIAPCNLPERYYLTDVVFIGIKQLITNEKFKLFFENFRLFLSLEGSKANTETEKIHFRKNYITFALGAGVSIPSNISNWETLCRSLGYELFFSNVDEEDYTKFMKNTIVQIVNDSLFQEMDKSFALDSFVDYYLLSGKRTNSDYYYALYKILYSNFDVINDCNTPLLNSIKRCINKYSIQELLTYNFDSVVESAIDKKYQSQKSEILQSITNVKGVKIYHVHGYIPFDYSKGIKVNNLILTDEDFYNNAQKKKSFANITQFNILCKYDVFFVGCSFVDSNLKEILKTRMNSPHSNNLYAFMKIPNFELNGQINNIAIAKYKIVKETYLRRLGVEVFWVNKFEDIPREISNL